MDSVGKRLRGSRTWRGKRVGVGLGYKGSILNTSCQFHLFLFMHVLFFMHVLLYKCYIRPLYLYVRTCTASTHLTRSNARTVPSRLADTSAWPLGRNCTAVMGAVWSVKVTKQKPDDCWNTLTCGWRQMWGRCEKRVGQGCKRGQCGSTHAASSLLFKKGASLWKHAGLSLQGCARRGSQRKQCYAQ